MTASPERSYTAYDAFAAVRIQCAPMPPVGCARQFDPSRAIASKPYEVVGDAARAAPFVRHDDATGRAEVTASDDDRAASDRCTAPSRSVAAAGNALDAVTSAPSASADHQRTFRDTLPPARTTGRRTVAHPSNPRAAGSLARVRRVAPPRFTGR